MAEILLIRHGQASFGEANYDKLSPLGIEQSRLLGEYLARSGSQYDRIISGTMVRHHETTEALLAGLQQTVPVENNEGLNEYNHTELLQQFKQRYPDQWAESQHARRDYFHNMKTALDCWMKADIADDGKRSWATFTENIINVFELSLTPSTRRTLIVSSGGPIAVMLGHVLQLKQEKIRDLSLQIKNTSTHKLLYNQLDITLDSYNDVTHLSHEPQKNLITFS